VPLLSSRRWIALAGPKGRKTTFVFSLLKSGLVEFVVIRVAPNCEVAGRFHVRGKAGVNRVPFRGRIGRRVLRPGTYIVRARKLVAKSAVFETRIAIFPAGKPTPGQVSAALASDVCPNPAFGIFGNGGAGGWLAAAGGTGGEARLGGVAGNASDSTLAGLPAPQGEVLGETFARAGEGLQDIPLLVWFLIGLAGGLLGAVLALPRFAPNLRAAELLADRQNVVAAGVALASLAAVYLVFLFSLG
jgi:hypothetical protein